MSRDRATHARRRAAQPASAADAAAEVFCERGLESAVAEIAQRAGVGRATLFRNFPEQAGPDRGNRRRPDAGRRPRRARAAARRGSRRRVFGFIAEIVGRQQMDRALFEAVADEFLANAEIRAAYEEVIAILEELLGSASGTVSYAPRSARST